MAKQLGISPKNVIQRYNRLKGKVLTKATISVSLDKIGFKSMAHLFIKISNRSKMQEIMAQIFKIPNMIIAIKLVGPYDVRALVVIHDFEDLFEVTETFRRIKGIEKADTYLYKTFPHWPGSLFAPYYSLRTSQLSLKRSLPLNCLITQTSSDCLDVYVF